MKKILIISAFAPSPNTAGQAFTERLLTDLIVDHKVDIISFSDNVTNISADQKNVTTVESVNLTLLQRLKGVLSLPFLHPLFTCRFSFHRVRLLRSIVNNYDVILFNFSQVFIYSLFLNHPAKVALAHDVVSQMYGRKIGFMAWFNSCWCKSSERYILSRASSRIACFSDKDCKLLWNLFSVKASRVDFYLDDRISNINPVRINSHGCFVFYGAWGRRENSSGLLWFLSNVMPSLERSCRFLVIGGGINAGIRNAAARFGDAVEFAGFVDDPFELLVGARALVAPLFEGAGVKVKVLESLACGTPVIGTDTAFEGIEVKPEYSCSTCNTLKEFADALNGFHREEGSSVRASFLSSYPAKTMGAAIRDVSSEH